VFGKFLEFHKLSPQRQHVQPELFHLLIESRLGSTSVCGRDKERVNIGIELVEVLL